MADYDVIVIGAGCGGLAAGGILAKQGRKVLVIEQSDIIGGCCSTFEKDGYQFDVGASIVEVIHPLARALEMMGADIAVELDLIPCDPIYDFILEDGTRFSVPVSVEETTEVFEKLSPADARAWPGFARYMSDFTKFAVEVFFGEPLTGFADMARIFAANPQLLKFGPLFTGSYQGVIEKYFESEAVRQTAAYQAFYLGLPPELAPGIFAMLMYSEHEGIYYPRGGMIEIPRAFARCGERHGMEVRTGQRVARVLLSGGAVRGVALADGTEITADVVVGNINAKTLYLDLIGEQHLPYMAARGIKSYEPSMSVPMLYLGLDYEPPLTAHHTLATVSMDKMNAYWRDVYMKGLLSDDPFGLLCWPTRSDPSLAPEGHHVLNLILTPGPYELAGTDWDSEKQGYAERAVAHFERLCLPGLSEHVKVMELSTPLDFERRLLHPRGAIYGLQQEITAEAMFRPSARSRAVKGLYLAGASTHPGGGVPSVIASGITAAGLVDRYS